MVHAALLFLRKLRHLAGREGFRRELEEEIELHAELKYREHTSAGLSRKEAAERTSREMGNMAVAAEESGDIRSFLAVEEAMKDIRYSLRLLARQPAFSLVVILSLALGIAGNTAVFTTVNALLIKPLPFRDPERLVRITEVYPKALQVYFQQNSRSMEVAAASPGMELNVKAEGPAFRITTSGTTANLFEVLGVGVKLGRVFEAGEDRPGREPVAILSHDLWRSHFQSNPNAIGRVIRVNETDRRIVGIMPAGFAYPSARVQLWYPAPIDPRNVDLFWAGEFVPMIGRLRNGSTMEQAKAEVRSLAAPVWKMFPFPMPRNFNSDSTVIPLQTDLAGDARTRVLLLLCAVGAVLVIACTNIASLLLARAITRRKEIALRAALGAGQGRIVRQLLTESLVLSGAGGALGLLLGSFAVELIRAVVPAELTGASRIQVDWTVAAFTAVLCLLCGLSFGLAPALAAARMSLAEAVKTGGQRSAGLSMMNFRSWLVGGQIALTLVLIVGASLLIRSLHALSNVKTGFETHRIVAMKVSPDASFCAEPAACIAFYERLMEEARGVPGIADAAIASTIPLDGSFPTLAVDVEGHPKSTEFPAPMFWNGAISPSYLRLTGIPLLAGRAFADSDTRESEPVLLINASTAKHFWPGENPIGKRIKPVFEIRWRTVVGVVADVRQFNLQNQTPDWISGMLYVPYRQAVQGDRRIPSVMNVVARTSSRAPQAAEELQRLAIARNPNIPVGEVVTLEKLAGDSVSNFRATTWLFLSFAAVALFLATIGIYGMVSYTVTQRAFEVSIRMAIGATADGIAGMVLRRSLKIALLGVAAGLAGAFVVIRGLSTLLYEVAPTDPLIYGGVAMFLLGITVLASLIPAWRAAHIDPIRVLRAE